MDVLAKRLVQHALEPKAGIGIKLAPRAERIPCLFFADDSLLFCKATSQAADQLKHLLDTFCHQSGQLINLHKSLIVFSKNTSSLDKQHVQGVLNIPTSSALGKYLGCASFQGRPTLEIFQNLSQKAQTKLTTWKASSLSKAGRVVLIQSNLEALPSHTMQCFQLPASIASDLDRINREFFWKKSNTEKGLPMVAWDTICRPKKLGGLGLRKTSAVNTAFVAKLSWKFLTQPNNYWVQQMRARYCLPDEFFHYKKKQTDSWAWKCMLRVREFVKRGIRWKLGNGQSISFWSDRWCHELPLIELLDPDRASTITSQVKVRDFLTQGKLWDVAKLSQVLPQHLVKLVLAVPIPTTNMDDSFCWGFTGSGDFTVKSATWQAHETIKPAQESWKFHWIWQLDVMPKIKIFLWQLCHNALPARATLLGRGLYIDPICPACLSDIEDSDHLFVGCHVAKETWELAVNNHWLSSQPFSHLLHSVREGLHELHRKHDKDITRVAILLWSLWKSRNALIFRNEVPNPISSLVRAKRIWTE